MEIGIDLGTTHSLIAVYRNGKPELIPNALGKYLTPSVVGIDDNGELLVGQAARERLISHPDKTVHSFKRMMGTKRQWSVDKHRFRAEELSALLLKVLKQDAETYLGCEVKKAVISVPAYFNETQRNATVQAAEMAGLAVSRLINEPTAAALVYGLQDRKDDHRYLILDLGGGTFDVTLLEYFDGVFEVHASAGDNQLGGEDFTQVICDWLRETCRQNSIKGVNDARLYQLAELAKRGLSSEAVVELNVTPDFNISINREQQEKLSNALLLRLRTPIMVGLQDAGLTPESFDDVILVGGATRMPLVQKFIGRLFRRIPRQTIDPDTVVALGAAVQAGMLERDESLEDVVMTDVMPYSLGIAVHNPNQQDNLLFDPIIERNQTVPVSRMKSFFPVHDGQTELCLQIYQGESLYVKNNLLLGEMKLQLPKLGHQRHADVRFTYDSSGLLEVLVAAMGPQGSMENHRMVIEQSPGKLSDKEIEAALARLNDLKIHPRDNQVNRTLLARAERLYEQSVGEARQKIGAQVAHFHELLVSQEDKLIAKGREALEHWLDAFEAQRW